MLNILHMICSFKMGGAEKLLLDIMEYNSKFPSNKYSMKLVVVNDEVDSNLINELNKVCVVYLLNRKKGNKNIKYLFQLYKIIKKDNIDIVHCHDHGSKKASILLKLITNIKLVYTVHDSYNFSNLNKIKILIHKYFVDINIAISKSVKKYINNYGIYNVKVIYNGIHINKYVIKSSDGEEKKIIDVRNSDGGKSSVNNYLTKKSDAKKSDGGNKDSKGDGGSSAVTKKSDGGNREGDGGDNVVFKIINVSRVDHRIKGQDILIKALSLCKEKNIRFKCTFVGDKYDVKSWEYLHSLINKYELEKDIEFIGNSNEVPKLLAENDLFVLCSRKEGFGIVLLEAMASKLPIISSNIEGPSEIIRHKHNGLLYEKNNIKELSKIIIHAYNNYEEMLKYAKNAYDRILYYDISYMYNNYLVIYNHSMLKKNVI